MLLSAKRRFVEERMGNCGAKKSAESDVEAGPPSETTLRKKAELQAVLDADGIKREVCK